MYENYNKFISATETIRKMSSNFEQMEEELQSLSSNMDAIIAGSQEIHEHLKDKRSELSKLSSTYSLLQKLHFLFELTPKMREFMRDSKFNEAVRYYLKAEKALEQYRHFASIRAIDEECRELLTQLKDQLYQQFEDAHVSGQQMSEAVHLLLGLGEDSVQLARRFLAFWDHKLDTNRSQLDYYLSQNEKMAQGVVLDDVPMDVLEFVDMACNGLLSNLASVLVSFDSLFLSDRKAAGDEERDMLSAFAERHVGVFVERVKQRVSQEQPMTADPQFLVRALDRLYSRLHALRKVYTDCKDLRSLCRDLVVSAARDQCTLSLQLLKQSFGDELIQSRQAIATSPNPMVSSSQLVSSIATSLEEEIQRVLAYLNTFRQPEVHFLRDSGFENEFTRTIREQVVVAHLFHVIHTMEEYQKTGSTWSAPPQLVLVLSRVCYDLDASLVSRILNTVDDVLKLKGKPLGLTDMSEVSSLAKTAAQSLLNHYVTREGAILSQMCRKSVETRDWLSTAEPRSVRSVMKRLVEDVTAIEAQVADLYEEGTRVERSSDSSRTFSAMGVASTRKSGAGGAGGGTGSGNNVVPWNNYCDQNLLSNIQKLFAEKVQVFSVVEFSKLSVLTGVITIVLKTLVECIRLCTFSKFGLQQVSPSRLLSPRC